MLYASFFSILKNTFFRVRCSLSWLILFKIIAGVKRILGGGEYVIGTNSSSLRSNNL
jgi:hypothetical protein